MPESIFISYSKCDDFVTELKTRLLRADIKSVWRDKDDIVQGNPWAKAIDDALEAAALVVLVISPVSMNSAYVTYEWRRAKFELYKELHPIYLQACDDGTGVYGRLRKLQLPIGSPLSDPVTSGEWDEIVERIKHRLELLPTIDKVGEQLTSSRDQEPRWEAARELGSFDKFPSRARDWLHKGIELIGSGLDGTDLAEIARALSKVGDPSSYAPLCRGFAKQKEYPPALSAVADAINILSSKSYE